MTYINPPRFLAQKPPLNMENCNIIQKYHFSIFRYNVSVFGNHREHFLKDCQFLNKYNLYSSGILIRFIPYFWHFSIILKNNRRKRCIFHLFVLLFTFFLVILYNIKHFLSCVNGIILSMYGKMLDISENKRTEAQIWTDGLPTTTDHI